MIKRTLQFAVIAVTAGGLVAWIAGNSGKASLHDEAAVEATESGEGSLLFDRSSREEILAVARATVFDVRYGTGDQQRLMVGECPDNCRYGPLVEVQAAKNGHELSESELAAGQFVGRIINHDVEPYPRLNLAGQDTTYVWVEKADGKWRAVYVPATPGATLIEKGISIESHTQEPWRQSGARWVSPGGSEVPWFICTELGCCKLGQ